LANFINMFCSFPISSVNFTQYTRAVNKLIILCCKINVIISKVQIIISRLIDKQQKNRSSRRIKHFIELPSYNCCGELINLFSAENILKHEVIERSSVIASANICFLLTSNLFVHDQSSPHFGTENHYHIRAVVNNCYAKLLVSDKFRKDCVTTDDCRHN
jgi:hypothetical protein